jgi:hypothetical protein
MKPRSQNHCVGSTLGPFSTERAPISDTAQIEANVRERTLEGVVTGQADKASVRIDHGLLQAAARKIGSTNTTEVTQAALAAFVAPDPFVDWLLSDKDRLPADFGLAI